MAFLFSRVSRSPLVQSFLTQPIPNPLFILSRTFASKKVRVRWRWFVWFCWLRRSSDPQNIFRINIQHKAILRLAKGYRGRSKNCYRLAVRRVEKSWEHAFRDRRLKKRTWRRLWIQRLTAASRQYGVRYSRLIAHMRYCQIWLNRKVFSELAATEPFAFKACMDVMQRQNEMYQAGKIKEEEEAATQSMAA
jgi:large subunit ribosomal protein L20